KHFSTFLHLSFRRQKNILNRDDQIIEFTLLFNKFKKRLYNYVLKMSADRMLTDDIVQDVFIKLYQNLDSIRNKQSIQFWLFKSARNELYTILRNTKLKKLYSESDNYDQMEVEDTVSLAVEFDFKELNKMVMDELDKINPDQKEIFILKEYSGLSYKEIAVLMDIDEELVKSRLYKVRQKLIKRISKYVE
ncbi:MAG TPA: RNA polymerase sigma factor, partial [Ignavibacteriaceae bacterium]|nr:RNA polymerase sigma factor [Ignavibacteriaceae bacterium]